MERPVSVDATNLAVVVRSDSGDSAASADGKVEGRAPALGRDDPQLPAVWKYYKHFLKMPFSASLP